VVLDTGTGKRGRFIYFYLGADGAAIDARRSSFTVYIDGVEQPDCEILHILQALFFIFPQNAGRMGISENDDTNYQYAVWVLPNATFTDSLKVVIKNGDAANATRLWYSYMYEVR